MSAESTDKRYRLSSPVTPASEESVTGSATEYAAAQDTRYLSLFNSGDYEVWIGGSNVDGSSRIGHKINPGGYYTFQDVQEGFKIYHRSVGGTSYLSPMYTQ